MFYLFANWKMYLDFNESNILANALANEFESHTELVSVSSNSSKKSKILKKIPKQVRDDHKNIEMAVFPSALAFYPVAQVLGDVGVKTGAQNVYYVDKGGYTGEISALMYKNAGARYALVGHSERRHIFGETNKDTRLKMEDALSAGLTPVLCVGEKLEERKDGKTEQVIEIQLRSAFHELAWKKDTPLIIAYEPVWAIGTGHSCEPHDAREVHEMIEKKVAGLTGVQNPAVIYGGSVRPENVKEYFAMPGVGGVLVGQASTKLDSWIEIIKQAPYSSPRG